MGKEGRKIKILYAEDNAETRELYLDILIAMGYDVCTVNDGDEAVRMCKYGNFDLLLLDVILPGKRGDEILRWMRSRGDRTPVVILSSTNRHTLLTDEGYEADEYIDKAISSSEFEIRLKKVLCRAWGNGMEDQLTDRVSFNRQTYILTIDGKAHLLNYMHGCILSIICANKDRGVSPEDLCMQLWNRNLHEEKNNRLLEELRSYISYIRKLLEKDPRIKLKKIRGGNYILSIMAD